MGSGGKEESWEEERDERLGLSSPSSSSEEEERLSTTNNTESSWGGIFGSGLHEGTNDENKQVAKRAKSVGFIGLALLVVTFVGGKLTRKIFSVDQPGRVKHRCNRCAKKDARVKCKRCKKAWYCTQACLKAAWKLEICECC